MKYQTIVFLFLVFITKVNAQNDEAKAIVKVIYSEKTIDKMVDNYQNYFKQIASSVYKNENDTNFLNFMQYCIGKTKGIMHQMVEQDLPSVYSNNFSIVELEAINKFYNSDAGKKYLEKTPQISKDVQDLMVKKYLPILQKDLENYLKK